MDDCEDYYGISNCSTVYTSVYYLVMFVVVVSAILLLMSIIGFVQGIGVYLFILSRNN